jgi:hypothetical protein
MTTQRRGFGNSILWRIHACALKLDEIHYFKRKLQIINNLKNTESVVKRQKSLSKTASFCSFKGMSRNVFTNYLGKS